MKKVFLLALIIASSFLLPLNNYADDEAVETVKLYLAKLKKFMPTILPAL